MLLANYPYLSPAITAGSRDRILEQFPAARGEDAEALAHRRLLSVFLSMEWMDKDGNGIVMPYDRLAALLRVHPKARGFNAGAELERISQELVPLKIIKHNRHRGLARVVSPEIPQEIDRIWRTEVPERPGEHLARVDFLTGEEISRRRRVEQLKEHEIALRGCISEPMQEDSRALFQLLNTQSNSVLQDFCRKNWSGACLALDRIQGSNSRRRAISVMRQLAEQQLLRYSAVQRSHRLFAIGTNLIQLPRDVRNCLLAGAFQHDLHAAQMAIVARLWHITPLLDSFEKLSGSVWSLLLDDVGLEEIHKPCIKTAAYTIIFGGPRWYALSGLIDGRGASQALTKEKAEAFLLHPLMVALLHARDAALEKVRRDGGVLDAFGDWHQINVQDRGQTEAAECRSLLAMQVQSYEQRVMYSLIPILQGEQESVRPVAWIHDGLVTHVTNATKRDRIYRRLEDAVVREAAELRIPTNLVTGKIN